MASDHVTRASLAQQSLVERCFAWASKKVKHAALLAVQQLPVHWVHFLDSHDADGLLQYAVAHLEDRTLCKLLVKHNKELVGAELVYAAHYGKEERVRQLLAEGISVDARDEQGRTPLIAVAVSDDLRANVDLQLRLARVLLEAGASVDATVPNAGTALSKSVAQGRFALAHLLLDVASTNINLHKTALLHLLVPLCGQGLSHSPPGTEGWEIGILARRLVAAGVPVDVKSAPGSLTPLSLAVGRAVRWGLQCEEQLALIDLLLDLGADPRAQEDVGRGVLVHMAAMLAAYDHHTPLNVANFRRLLQRLVAAGADINTRSWLGCTVLGLVCKACTKPVLGPPEPLLRAFVEAGADLQAQQPEPLSHLVLPMSPGPNAPSTLRALAGLGYPMNVLHHDRTALQSWLLRILATTGFWPEQQPPSPLQLSCLEALVDAGCPLVTSSQENDRHSGIFGDAEYLLSKGISTGSLAVVEALLRACPVAAGSSSIYLGGATALEVTTKELCQDLKAAPEEELERPLEGLLGEQVLWYCTVAPLLLAAGSPPPRDKYLDLSALPPSCQDQLRFLPLVAHGSSWSPERHHLYPPAFCAAARQLLLIHECCGFGASQPSSGQAHGAGRKRRAGSRRSCKPARAMGIQLPQGILHHILGLASQPLLGWVTPHN